MFKLILFNIVIVFYHTYAWAYLGPGIAGGIIAATIGIVIALIGIFFGLVWLPIKYLIKKYKISKKKNTNKY